MLKTPLKTLLDILINHFTKERLVTLILTADEKFLIFMLEHENANDYKNAFFKTIANTLLKTMFYSVTLKITTPNLTSFFTMKYCIKKKLTRF